MHPLVPERLGVLVLLGAHCDDIPIGAGGTPSPVAMPEVM